MNETSVEEQMHSETISIQILEIQRKIALLENDISMLSQTLELIQQERVNLSTKLVEKRTSYVMTEEDINTKFKEQQVNTQMDLEANEYAGTCKLQDDAYKNTMKEIDAATAELERLTQIRSELASEHHKPELRDLPSQTLEEELQALISDKGGETEYQESLQSEIDTIKGISHSVKCGCGEEYKVKVELCV